MSANGRAFTSHPPAIPIEQAKACRFVLAGQTYQVSTCSVDVLRSLVRSALPDTRDHRRARPRKYLLDLLALLDTESDELTRWYVIEELVALKVKVQFVA